MQDDLGGGREGEQRGACCIVQVSYDDTSIGLRSDGEALRDVRTENLVTDWMWGERDRRVKADAQILG